ncbi:MAG: dTDP-4-dehydrorhamnose 3,5-epimerase [Parachlamydiales bacterium]|jgi:dTDP-4-dehydrorhamnose 3,5-epimerase
MEVQTFAIEGLKLIRPRLFCDRRGYFLESFRRNFFQSLGLPEFVQENHAFSKAGALRGMHFQKAPGQAKLVTVVSGEIFDVAVDMRPSSASFGKWQGVYLNDRFCEQFFLPSGFAHGYLVVSPTAHVLYKVSHYYDPALEGAFAYADPELKIKWPLNKNQQLLISEKDLKNGSFQEALALC